MNAKRLQTTLMTAVLALALAGCAGAAPATPAPAQATAAPTMAMPATVIPAPTQMPAPTAAPTMAMPATAMPAAAITATADAMMHGGMMMTLTVAVPATAVPAATAAPKPAGKTVMADIQVFQFMPNVLEVKAGTTVVWTNKDNIEHSITNGVPGKPGGKFDSGFFTQGKTFSFTFTEAGEYPYFCMRHNSMQGMVRVTP